MRSQTLTYLAASALLAMATSACVGEYEMNPAPPGEQDDDDDSDGDVTAEEMFNSTVAEGLQAECGACHAGTDLDDVIGGPDWLGPDLSSMYSSILGFSSVEGLPLIGPTPGDSQLYYKGAHPPGTALSDALKAKVADWILAQAVEDGIEPEPEPEPDPNEEEPAPTGPDTLVEALELFSSCMTYEDFQATQFGNVADQNTAEGQCSGCHGQGTGGAFLSASNLDFYVNQRKMPYVLKFVTGTVNDNGSFKDLIISRRYELKRDDNGHPNYIMSEDRLDSIRDFFDLTYIKYQNSIAAGTPCTPDDPINNPPP